MLPLAQGNPIPQFGFGTYGLGARASEAILHALKSGYCHLDSADIYHTHSNIAEALQQSGIAREEMFIVSKLWSRSLAANAVSPAVERFLSELRSEYIDLLLIHWPAPGTPVAEPLRAMEQTRKAGMIKAIGVSNFDVRLIKESLASGVKVANNQIEYNLNHQPKDILDFCLHNGVTVTAYSPLERGTSGQEAMVADLTAKYSATREQVLLNWLMAKGMIVIPRSSVPANIESNFRSLEWEMAEEDVNNLDKVG